MGGAQAGSAGNEVAVTSGSSGCRGLHIGVDIGGTTISVGLVDGSGALLGSPRDLAAVGGGAKSPVHWEPLGDDPTPSRVADRVRELVEATLLEAGHSMSDVRAVGVCTPGLLDIKKGIVRSAANLRGWQQAVPICDLVAEALRMDRASVVLENDTNAALLAEVWVGAAVGRDNVVLMTLGTGIGGSIMCDGRLLRGSRGQAGEVGHAILVPDGHSFGSAGVGGIFEGYASASAVAARAAEGGGPPEGSSLRVLPSPPDSAEVFRHAEQGDAFALEVVRETAKYLAIGCINCARLVDPDVILFAGGMAQAGEFLLRQVREQYAKYHWNLEPVRVELLLAAAGAHAGVIGAARAAELVIAA